MVATQRFLALKEGLEVDQLDCVTMQEDPLRQDVQVGDQLLQVLEVLGEFAEEDIEIIKG